MAVRILSHLISLLALRSEITVTIDQLEAHPLTQGFVPAFQGVREDWGVVFNEELALNDKISSAKARIYTIDLKLNGYAGDVAKAVLSLTGDDRTHPLFIAYFESNTLGEFKKPILGSQLESMRGWIKELKGSDIATLAALGPKIEEAVNAADMLVKERDALEADLKFFRDTGSRRKLVEKVNGLRKKTHGELGKMPHDMLGLPTRFADQFFLHASGSKNEAPTIESLDQEIEALQEDLTAKLEMRKALEDEAKEVAEAAKRATLAELQKVADEAAKKAAEAQAKIDEISRQ